MDVCLIGKILQNNLRRHLIKFLTEKPLTTKKAFKKIKGSEVDVKYRQSVYRALEDLCDADLVNKIYNENVGIHYKLEKNKLVIDFKKNI